MHDVATPRIDVESVNACPADLAQMVDHAAIARARLTEAEAIRQMILEDKNRINRRPIQVILSALEIRSLSHRSGLQNVDALCAADRALELVFRSAETLFVLDHDLAESAVVILEVAHV